MSTPNQARRTAFTVGFRGVDITEAVRPYFLSMTYTDNEKDEVDDFQLVLQDREGLWREEWLGDAVRSLSAAVTGGKKKDKGEETTAPTLEGLPYTVNSPGGLPVYAGPGEHYGLLGWAEDQAKVEVFDTGSTGWASIRYNGVAGCVDAARLQRAREDTFVKLQLEGDTTRAGSYRTPADDRIPVRSGPGEEYGQIGEMNKGETVQVLMVAQGWAMLNYRGMMAGYLKYTDLEPVDQEAAQKAEADQAIRIQAAIVRENWANDGKDVLLDCGDFELDAVQASGPPETVTIKGTALPFRMPIRQTRRSKAWEAYRLSGIAREMARAGGMSCMYLSSSDPFYERAEQFEVSDIEFLSGLCHNAGLSLKAAGTILVIFDQAEYEQKPAVRTVERGKGYISYALTAAEAGTRYASCRVRCVDAAGNRIEGIAYAADFDSEKKDENQQLEIHAKVSSPGEARDLAEKQLRLYNKYSKEAEFVFPGDPSLAAGVTVRLTGWGGWDGTYLVKQAVHSVGGGGYTTKILLRPCLEGGT